MWKNRGEVRPGIVAPFQNMYCQLVASSLAFATAVAARGSLGPTALCVLALKSLWTAQLSTYLLRSRFVRDLDPEYLGGLLNISVYKLEEVLLQLWWDG